MGKAKKFEQRDTVVMSREELDAILGVDAAIARREEPHERPTVNMPAVKAG